MESGQTLTPFILYAMSFAPPEQLAPHRALIDRALGRADAGVDVYPTYSRALWILALAAHRPAGYQERVRRLAGELRAAQLTGANGWSPADPEYGAWDYGALPPKKPQCQMPDISVTAFAVEALRAAGVDASDPALRAAKAFASGCHNLAGDGGGFFTTSPMWHVQNKAGPLPGGGFKSYGTTTADVLRIFRACGEDELRARAMAWLSAHFATERVPGLPAGGEQWDKGLQFYWLFSAACVADPSWKPRIRAELARLQRPDGSWRNDHVMMKEDDSLISTGLALAAWWQSR